uniref:Uncharacterized protein n=1 Tax=Rhipicephalus microplus TaxID=6941 RepID=A0A6M2DCF6_RHIMP
MYIQTVVAALFKFTTADDLVCFVTARGALLQECIDFYLQDSFLFFFFLLCCATVVFSCLGPLSHLVMLSGTVLCWSSIYSQGYVPMCVTKRVSNAKIRL